MEERDSGVVIVGGGLSGLCLAQALKTAGLRVAVYERDAAADARPQGTRLHINPTGSAALRACLPDDVFALFTATCGEYGSRFTVLNKDLRVLSETRESPDASPHAHRSVDRLILRRVLLTGLEDVTHFDRTFSRYEETPDGAIVAVFEDGSRVNADVVVGADGVRSRVRHQYLPQAEPFDTGVIMVGAKIPFRDESLTVLPHAARLGGALIVPGDAPCALVLASWKPEGRELQAIAELPAVPKLPETDQRGYAVLGFCARREYLGLTREELRTNGAGVKRAVQARIATWHPDLRALVELIDPSDLGVVPISSSAPVEPWRASRITLMGDAIHSMTPFQGSGANTALKDAQILSAELRAAFRNGMPPVTAIERYEARMRDYGFDAVGRSLAVMNHVLGATGNRIGP